MANVARSLVIGGTKYSVLRLSGPRGPAFLLRSEHGDVVGLFRSGGEPARLQAYALKSDARASAFPGFELFDDDGEVVCRPTPARGR